ncbi:MAG: YraN family protein [Christensenellales bacterium]
MKRKKTGAEGERIARQYLIRQGYAVIEQNYRTQHGELDLIAVDSEGTLVFVEVKTRTNTYYGLPRESVTTKKQARVRMVATEYMQAKNAFHQAVRFDVIEVFRAGGDVDIQHIKNAF